MNARALNPQASGRGAAAGRAGSVLVIVLWLSFGLVAIALYFAESMVLELRAADNRACGIAAEQATEAAARYVTRVLDTYATNGLVPPPTEYLAESVSVGDSRFWLIGRDQDTYPSRNPIPCFGLVDEASKLNLNRVDTNMLAGIPFMTEDFALAIADWRSTNSTGLFDFNYAQMNYVPKSAPFESTDELRLVYGSSLYLLAGEDLNRNGILDEREADANLNGVADPGILDLTTVFSREPNSRLDGSPLTNVNNRADLTLLLNERLGIPRANTILAQLGGGTVRSLLQFYVRSGMTLDEFRQIADDLTASSNPYTLGRVNINTAPADVLACLPNMNSSLAVQATDYRRTHPDQLATVGWFAEALGATNAAVQSAASGDHVTTRSYQYMADVFAVGPYGRGYRRTRFVFDMIGGYAQVVYRQDLSRLGWALGREPVTGGDAQKRTGNS